LFDFGDKIALVELRLTLGQPDFASQNLQLASLVLKVRLW